MDCKYCGESMKPRKGPGRPKETCNASCRQLFYLTKKAVGNKALLNRVQKAIRAS